MPILIDGHNLIGQGSIPDVRLTDADDEYKLVLLLRRYAARKRGRRIEVVFDQGNYGQPGTLNGYGVKCLFARPPRSADHELIRRIRTIKRRGEWQVVTSDRAVAGEARARGIAVISSQDFASRLLSRSLPTTAAPDAAADVEGAEDADDALAYKQRPPGPAEVQEWLRIFGVDSEDDASGC
jgi:hypothetical protein